MTTQSYTNFPQTHHVTPSVVNFQRKKIKMVYIKEMADRFSMAVLFYSPCQLSFRHFLYLYPN